MVSAKINTNDSSNPLDKQFTDGIRYVFLRCSFFSLPSDNIFAIYQLCHGCLCGVHNFFLVIIICLQKRSQEKAKKRHDNVMRLLVRRYITAEQRKRDDYGITEDDVMEIRQDISTLRFELIDILSTNGMKTPNIKSGDVQCMSYCI